MPCYDFEEIGVDGLEIAELTSVIDDWTYFRARYLFGSPNYPVPAIRTRVNIFGDVVIIWNHHTSRASYVCVKEGLDAPSINRRK